MYDLIAFNTNVKLINFIAIIFAFLKLVNTLVPGGGKK